MPARLAGHRSATVVLPAVSLLLALAWWTGAFRAGAGPARAAVDAIPLPHSRVVVQNLEPEPIDLQIDLRQPDGALAKRLRFEDVPPYAPRMVELAELPDLPVGLYSAAITGTGRLAALARHAWPWAEGFEDQDLAIATASEPARDLVVPFLGLQDGSERALLAIQNPSLRSPARVELSLIPFANPGSGRSWQGSLDLAAGGSTSLDLSGPGFEGLEGAFCGFARLRSDQPVTASALSVLFAEGGDLRAAALEGQPSADGWSEVFVPFMTETRLAEVPFPANVLALVNPLGPAAELRLVYHPSSPDSCGELPIDGPSLRLEAGAGILLVHDHEAIPGLTPDCGGLLEIRSSGGAIVVADLFRKSEGEWPWVTAKTIVGPEADRLALPWLSWLKGYGATIAGAVNSSDAEVTVRREVIDAQGQPAHGVGQDIEIRVAPRRARSWNSMNRPDLMEGASLVRSDAPVRVHASEILGDGDAASYGALAIENADHRAQLPYLARPPGPVAPPPAPTPAPDPEEPAPERLRQLTIPPVPAWQQRCCARLEWAPGGELWGVEVAEDGSTYSVARYDADSGARIGAEAFWGWVTAFARSPRGELLGLDWGRQGNRIVRLDRQAREAGEIVLPEAMLGLGLTDFDVGPDGSIGFLDRRRLEVQRTSAEGAWLTGWPFHPALRHWADGGSRLAISPLDGSLWLLSWTRLLRFSPEGRWLTSIGAERFPLGPQVLEAPRDLAVDAAGRAYVVEESGRVQIFAPDGRRVTLWQAFDPREPVDSRSRLAALALAPDGRLAVADAARSEVHVFAALPGAAGPPIGGELYLPRLGQGARR